VALLIYQHSTLQIDKKEVTDFVKACLRQNPKSVDFRVRKKALKVLLLKVDAETALKICRHTASDQDPAIRCSFFRQMA
jgi:hypothetical protein